MEDAVKKLVAMCVALVGIVTMTASAEVLQYNFPIDGLQEVPPNSSPGSGWGMVTLDTDTNLVSWNITFQNLVAPATAAHLHGPANYGQNAGVQVGLGTPVSPIIGSTTISATQESQLLGGLWYVNIHSSAFPGGEIRGQVVPEPGMLALLGLAASTAFRRR
jgi:hypothetical protein